MQTRTRSGFFLIAAFIGWMVSASPIAAQTPTTPPPTATPDAPTASATPTPAAVVAPILAPGATPAPNALPTPTTPPTAAPSTAPSAAPTPSVTTTAAAIPLADLIAQTESASATVQGIDTDLTTDTVATSIGDQLPTFVRETGTRIDENAHIRAGSPSLDTLRTMLGGWREQRKQADTWAGQMTARLRLVDREITQLNQLDASWQQALTAAQAPALGTPDTVLHRVRAVIAAIAKTQATATAQQVKLLDLQNSVVGQQTRINDAIDGLQQANNEAISRLFVADSKALWNRALFRASQNDGSLLLQGDNSFVAQATGLAAYAHRHQAGFLLHGLILMLLVSGLFRLRAMVRPLVAADPDMARPARVFETPVATGIILSMIMSTAIYTDAPRLLWAILGAFALVPTVWILRRLVEPPLYPSLNALMAFYFCDQIRSVCAALPLLSRLLLTAELLGGVLFVALQIKSARLSQVNANDRDRLWKVVRVGSRIILGGLTIALIAAVGGYVSLANLIGDALLRSAYLALILYALARIVGGLVRLSLDLWPLDRLAFVRTHREMIWGRAHIVLEWLGLFLWTLRTLDMLALLGFVERGIHAVLTTPLVIGSFSLTLGHTVAFGVTIWLSFAVSRAVRFILNEDVYPRVDLPRGLPYAISTLLHYVILLVGFFIGVAATGFDMNKFTILAGAFGVGVGLGMQNIVNNFVSGLILLFERPVKVGDTVQIGDATGVVQSIGIRASIIRTGAGSEVIVPNGNLISNPVTNWTYSNNQRSITIPVTVAVSTEPATKTDPQRVMDLLDEIAKENPLIAKDPAPKALLTKFGATNMDFELHAWTDKSDAWEQVRSDLAVAINARFAAEKIGIS